MATIQGTISLQSNDHMDVFYTQYVKEDGIENSDEAMLNVEDPQFDSDKAWVSGSIPKMKAVHVEGDTSIIQGWYKGETFDHPIVITVYVECEMSEELEGVIAEDEQDEQDEQGEERSREYDLLEPTEINL